MEVILLEDIAGFGSRGEKIEVKRGYARNYLLPRNLALEATGAGARVYEERARVLETREAKVRAGADKTAARLNKISIHLKVQAGDDGKLFGSVTSQDIATAISSEGVEVDKKAVLLEEPLRELGVYHVQVKVFREIEGKVRVLVTKG